MPQRQEYLHRWINLLDDMIPAEEPEPDGVPVALDGLKFILEEVRRFARHHQDSQLSEMSQLLERLHTLNLDYASLSSRERPSTTEHSNWRRSVINVVQRMRQILAAEMSASDRSA